MNRADGTYRQTDGIAARARPLPRGREPGSGAAARADASPVAGDLMVTDLVALARGGDQRAWDGLVERYAPLIWSVCRTYRLSGADADDVSQNVWLYLVDHLGTVRDPAALPGWLITTTRRECFRVLRAGRAPGAAGLPLDAVNIPDERAAAVDQELLTAELQTAVREAFTGLPACCQQLLGLMMADPPVPYTEISTRLGIAVGSIGPNRGRCLDKLRRHPAVATLIDAGPGAADGVRAAPVRGAGN